MEFIQLIQEETSGKFQSTDFKYLEFTHLLSQEASYAWRAQLSLDSFST